MKETRSIADLQLNEVVRLWPESVAVFGRHGMDTCCGGSLAVREAASRHGLQLETLLQELEDCRPAT